MCFRVRILKSALLPHANTQSSDVIAYFLADCTISWMPLCTGLTLYNQVKNLITCEWQLTEVVECFKLYFDFQANTGRIWGLYVGSKQRLWTSKEAYPICTTCLTMDERKAVQKCKVPKNKKQ